MIICLLDNIRSAYNVGSVFRTSDCAGVDKLILCGITPTPPHSKIDKTALGAIHSIKWEYHESALLEVMKYKNLGFKIYALEVSTKSIDYKSVPHINQDILLIFGNEIDGVNGEILKNTDAILEIPNKGIKSSLNVANCFAITVYHFCF